MSSVMTSVQAHFSGLRFYQHDIAQALYDSFLLAQHAKANVHFQIRHDGHTITVHMKNCGNILSMSQCSNAAYKVMSDHDQRQTNSWPFC